MTLFDICIAGLVLIIFFGRFLSSLPGLKFDLVSKNHATMLSSVCQLLGLIDAGGYFASRVSIAGVHHPGWVTIEITCLVSLGLLFGPACRSLLPRTTFMNSARTQPGKSSDQTIFKNGVALVRPTHE